MRALIYKLVIFLILIIVGQTFLTYATPPKTPRSIRLLNQYLGERREIIYLGDSSVHNVWEQDKDKSTISEMLQKRLPLHTVGRVSAAAYHLDLYLEFVKYIAESSIHPKLIIMPINLRSFSPEWDMRPEYQFKKEQLFLSTARNSFSFVFYRPLVLLTDLTPIDREDYLNTSVFDGGQKVGKVKEFDDPSYQSSSSQKIRNKMVFQYMYSLSKDHRKIRSMLQIIDLLHQEGIPFIFYITPVDYQSGKEYVGEQFCERLTENTRFIHALFESKGSRVLDLSMSLGTAAFNWGGNARDNFVYPNEHLKEDGRRFVAEQLSKRIEEELEITWPQNTPDLNISQPKPAAQAGSS
jgi:hypothetical protein